MTTFFSRILILFLFLSISLSGKAENRLIFYDEAGFSYGMLSRVSSNGLWVVGTDDGYQTGSFLICTTDPEHLTHVAGGELYDVTNEGVAVGAVYENLGTAEEPVNYAHAAIYANGAWVRLPEPANIASRSYARSVSADGRYIGGMAFCKAADSDMGAKYYPCIWTRNDATGKYTLQCFNSLQLPSNMGFYAYDMTEDGTTLVGLVCANAGSFVPAMIKNGEYICWNDIYTQMWPFEINGETNYYDTGFIDGIVEGAQESYWFDGGLFYIHGNYAFGHRSIATEVDEGAGTGTVTHHRSIYNLATGEFIDEPSATYFSCGIDPTHTFITTNNKAYFIADETMRKVSSTFGVQSDEDIAAVYAFDDALRVFACSAVWFNEAIGEYCEKPALLLLDEPAADGIRVVHAKPSQPASADLQPYDLQGRRISSRAFPHQGFYIQGGQKRVRY